MFKNIMSIIANKYFRDTWDQTSMVKNKYYFNAHLSRIKVNMLFLILLCHVHVVVIVLIDCGASGIHVDGLVQERRNSCIWHDDVIKWKYFPRYWPFVRLIHRSSVNSPKKCQWRGVLMISLICAWTNGWVKNHVAADLKRHRAHYYVTVVTSDTSMHQTSPTHDKR